MAESPDDDFVRSASEPLPWPFRDQRGQMRAAVKRAFDFAGAAVGLLIASPLIFVLVIAIKWGSKGPGIFSQDRVGRDRRLFRCHKLRTMQSGAPNVPTHQSNADLITHIGRFLRDSKLDELPQLWNVLRGEMSFVGPRPCLPSQLELIEERNKRGVFTLRPGITGLAQVNGIDMSDWVRLAEKDADYLREQSFGLDLRILCRTLVRETGDE